MEKCTNYLIRNIRESQELSEPQKKILKEFFELGPNLIYGINRKLKNEENYGKTRNKTVRYPPRHGKSYNKNLDALVQLNLLQHKEHYKQSSKIKSDEIGESSYHLTIWGVIEHLRITKKITPSQIIITDDEIEPPDESTLTNDELDKVLPHLKNIPTLGIIERKWNYLCQNHGGAVYDRLYDMLLLANYYYEWLNADFVGFEKSVLKDILLQFFLPYRFKQPFADNWIKSIVMETEIFDLLVGYFDELKYEYKLNQDIIGEYDKIIKHVRNGKKLKASKFLNANDEFMVKVSSDSRMKPRYIGNGPWGYRLSYVLNELNLDPIRYASSRLQTHLNYRIKRQRIHTKSHSVSKQGMS